MAPTQSIFQSASWEEMEKGTINHATAKPSSTMKQQQHPKSLFSPNHLVKVMSARVRYLRRHRLQSHHMKTKKPKSVIEKSYASDLLSNSANTVIGKVLLSTIDGLEELKSDGNTQEVYPPNQFKSGTSADDDISEISVSSEEEEIFDCYKDSSFEYVWILGMQFIVFDPSTKKTD